MWATLYAEVYCVHPLPILPLEPPSLLSPAIVGYFGIAITRYTCILVVLDLNSCPDIDCLDLSFSLLSFRARNCWANSRSGQNVPFHLLSSSSFQARIFLSLSLSISSYSVPCGMSSATYWNSYRPVTYFFEEYSNNNNNYYFYHNNHRKEWDDCY